MTKDAPLLHTPNNTLPSTPPPHTIDGKNNENVFIPPKVEVTLTDTVAAITVAVLACVVLITVVVIIRTIKHRRRAQQGNQLNHIPTISTGIMGTGVAAYTNTSRYHNNHNVEGSISWEPIDPVPSSSTSIHLPPRGDNSV